MKRLINKIILTISILSICAAANAAVVKVILRSEALVKPASAVTLKDIADIKGPKEPVKQLGNVFVLTAPIAGNKMSINSSYIKNKISSHSTATVEMSGADAISIIGKCIRVSSDELANTAKDFLTNQLPQGNRTYEVVVQRLPREVILTDNKVYEIKPRLIAQNAQIGINTIALDIMVDGSLFSSVNTALQVKAVAEVLVANTTIRQGDVVSLSNTQAEMRDISKINSPIDSGSISDGSGWIAKRTINVGTVLTSIDIKSQPIIKRGQTITLRVICGAVLLTTTAQAKQDGIIGDSIQVRSDVSSADVQAVVVEQGIAEIRR